MEKNYRKIIPSVHDTAEVLETQENGETIFTVWFLSADGYFNGIPATSRFNAMCLADAINSFTAQR